MAEASIDTPKPDDQSRNRRSLKHLFFKPFYQMRIGFPVIYLGLLMLATCAYLMSRELNSLDAVLNNPAADPAVVRATLIDMLQRLALIGLGTFAFYVAIASVFVLVINHRVAGPTHAIVHILKQYIAGNYGYRRGLRAHDELQPIHKKLTELGNQLAERRAGDDAS